MTSSKETETYLRWMIAGHLMTESPLHIGSGETVTRRQIKGERKNELAKISAVATDVSGRAYLPATALKGNIRERADELNTSLSVRESVFGTEHQLNDDDEARKKYLGGKAEFMDAPAAGRASLDRRPPFWDERRYTGVTASAAIARKIRTVGKKRLFYREFVPAGVTFQVRIGGVMGGEEEWLGLLCALEGFNSNDVSLGADAGNGWGRFSWDLKDVGAIDSQGVRDWLDAGAVTVGYGMLRSVGADRVADLRKKSQERAEAAAASRCARMSVMLHFNDHFLSPDPEKSKKKKAETEKKGVAVDAQPLRDVDGRTLLPSRSFRGPVRSQAERILRTRGGDRAACQLDDPCEAILSVKDVTRLCRACQIFGAGGWRAPVRVTPFKSDANGDGVEVTQEFLAVDRSTGGGADKKKFNVESLYRPSLKGQLKLDLRALAELSKTARAGSQDDPALRFPADQWVFGLLALVLRDLAEGDVGFGARSGKDYGSCVARFGPVELPKLQDIPQELRAVVSRLFGAMPLNKFEIESALEGSAEVKKFLRESLTLFEEMCAALKAQEVVAEVQETEEGGA